MTRLNETSAVQGLTHEASRRAQRLRQASQQHCPQQAPACPNGQAVQERQPRGPGHNEDRGEEGDEDVLDHVDEEVIVRPVVDGRHHGEEEQGQPAVEEQGAQSPRPGRFGAGTSAEIGEPGLVEHHDDRHDDHEWVEAPVVDQVIHAARPSSAGMLAVTVPRRRSARRAVGQRDLARLDLRPMPRPKR